MTPDEIKTALDAHGAWLRNEPNGQRAYLSGANLYGADLYGADLRGAAYSVLSVLAANWGVVPDRLCLWLMRLDAAAHPDPRTFDRWAAGGPCPYDDIRIQRAAQFRECPSLWKPGRPPRLWTIWAALAKEKGITI